MTEDFVSALAAALLAYDRISRTGTTIPARDTRSQPPFAILQLDAVRDATAQFIDVAAAEARGITTSDCSCRTWAGTT